MIEEQSDFLKSFTGDSRVSSRGPVKSLKRARRAMQFLAGMIGEERDAKDVTESMIRAGAAMDCKAHTRLTGDMEALCRYAVTIANLASLGHNVCAHGERDIEEVVAQATAPMQPSATSTIAPDDIDFGGAGL